MILTFQSDSLAKFKVDIRIPMSVDKGSQIPMQPGMHLAIGDSTMSLDLYSMSELLNVFTALRNVLNENGWSIEGHLYREWQEKNRR